MPKTKYRASYESMKRQEIPTEAQEQRKVVKYCAVRGIPCFHIPNGGQRGKVCAYQMKLQGVKAGVPDLCIPLARHGYHGLYIEMKRTKNFKLRDNQRAWIYLLNRNGYLARVCAGAENAIELIHHYVDGGADA